MSRVKPAQKLVSFSENKGDIELVRKDMTEGWSLISLVQNGSHYVGIMEKSQGDSEGVVYIPPRKKIKFSM